MFWTSAGFHCQQGHCHVGKTTAGDVQGQNCKEIKSVFSRRLWICDQMRCKLAHRNYNRFASTIFFCQTTFVKSWALKSFNHVSVIVLTQHYCRFNPSITGTGLSMEKIYDTGFLLTLHRHGRYLEYANYWSGKKVAKAITRSNQVQLNDWNN